MKSRSVFQWLGKTKPSLCKPAPPLFCSPQLNSPLPFTALGKTSGIYPTRLQKRRYFLYLHCTSTNGCQILCILGNSNSTDPILWMALKDGAHRYPMEQSPHGGLMAAQWVHGNCLANLGHSPPRSAWRGGILQLPALSPHMKCEQSAPQLVLSILSIPSSQVNGSGKQVTSHLLRKYYSLEM